MKIRETALIICLVSALICATGGIYHAFACGCGGHSNSAPAPAGQTVPLPVMVPPMPVYEKWKIRDVVHTFTEQGLAMRVGQGQPLSSPVISFDLSLGEGMHGRIETFREETKLKKRHGLFLGLNASGELHTWSFVKDNVLLILPGTIPEALARKYERALYSLKR